MFSSISSLALKIHICTVQSVAPSGLVDARSDQGPLFSKINTIFFGAEARHQVGDRIVVLSDGAQHFILGQVNEPSLSTEGTPTVTNLDVDLSSLADSKYMVSDNKMGTQARVVVSPGSGVVLDSGEWAVVHLDPGMSRITSMSERSESVNVSHSVDEDHDGSKAWSKHKWRTTADMVSMDLDMARERNDALDSGPSVSLDIGPDPDVLKMQYKVPGAPEALSTIEISSNGDVIVQAAGRVPPFQTRVNISSGGTFSIETQGAGRGKFEIDSMGRVWLGSEIVDLVNILDQTLTMLQAAMTITIFGPQPLINAPAFGVLQGLLSQIKTT